MRPQTKILKDKIFNKLPCTLGLVWKNWSIQFRCQVVQGFALWKQACEARYVENNVILREVLMIKLGFMIIHPHSDYSWPSKALSFGTCSWWDSTCISWGSTIVPKFVLSALRARKDKSERFPALRQFHSGGSMGWQCFSESWCRRSHGNTFLVVSSSNRFFWYWNPVQAFLLSPSNAFFLSLAYTPGWKWPECCSL